MSRPPPPLPTFPRSLEQFYVRIIGFILNDQGEFGFELLTFVGQPALAGWSMTRGRSSRRFVCVRRRR